MANNSFDSRATTELSSVNDNVNDDDIGNMHDFNDIINNDGGGGNDDGDEMDGCGCEIVFELMNVE